MSYSKRHNIVWHRVSLTNGSYYDISIMHAISSLFIKMSLTLGYVYYCYQLVKHIKEYVMALWNKPLHKTKYYIYIFLYIHIYIIPCKSIFIHIYMHIYIYIYTHTYVYTGRETERGIECVCACVCVCVSTLMWI